MRSGCKAGRKDGDSVALDVFGAATRAGQNAAIAVTLLGRVLVVGSRCVGAGAVPKVNDGVEDLAPPPTGGEQDNEREEFRVTPMVHSPTV